MPRPLGIRAGSRLISLAAWTNELLTGVRLGISYSEVMAVLMTMQSSRPFNPTSSVPGSVTLTRDDGTVRTFDLWRCDGRILTTDQRCNLVWAGRSLAIACAEHGHRNQYRVFYGTGDSEVSYVRKAQSRDGARPAALSQTPVVTPAPSPEPVADPVEQLRVLALSLGFRLSRIPVKQTPVTPVLDLDPEDTEIAF